MRKAVILTLTIAFLLIIAGVFAFSKGRIIFPPAHKKAFSSRSISSYPGKLQASGNTILDGNGKLFIMKGLMAPDPAKVYSDGNFKKSYYEGIHDKGANAIRIPVHPDRWVDDRDYLWKYIDPIVAWAGDMGMYAIIDWHYIGNIETGKGVNMPDIKEKPYDLTMEFWNQTAAYFKDVPNVIFEIYNEPADIDVDTWRKYGQEIINTIRSKGADQLIIAGGTQYSYDLSWVEEKKFDDPNTAYTSHVYPSKIDYDTNFGDISMKYPVLVTEWGFIDENRDKTAQGYLIGDEESFGRPLLDYLKERNIGWVACWYDDEWEPPMFTDNNRGETNYGKFVFKNLK